MVGLVPNEALATVRLVPEKAGGGGTWNGSKRRLLKSRFNSCHLTSSPHLRSHIQVLTHPLYSLFTSPTALP